jgi:hypothetical protein
VPTRRPVIAQQPEPAPFQSASPTSVLYRFPTRGEITIGAAKADILVTFGPPQVSVAGADRGQLQERMIYTEKSTGKKTTIAVINGKVTSADTVTAGDETQE